MSGGNGSSSGEQGAGHWSSLTDRLLVPLAEQLLAHLARSLLVSLVFMTVGFSTLCSL